MRQLIVQVEMSLDGVEDRPQDVAPAYQDEDVLDAFRDGMRDATAIVMGRTTYDGFSASWPTRSGPDAQIMNRLPKYVASTTLAEPLGWSNAQLLRTDAAEHVRQLKQESGGHILQYGAGELTRTLLDHGLVDELRFFIYPVVVGEGQRVWDVMAGRTLHTAQIRAFPNGAVLARYRTEA